MGLLKSRHMFVMYYSMLIFFSETQICIYWKNGLEESRIKLRKVLALFSSWPHILKILWDTSVYSWTTVCWWPPGFLEDKTIYFFLSHCDIQEYTRTILKRGLLCHLCHSHPSASVFFVFLYIFLTDFAYIKWKIACISPECFLLYIVSNRL